MERLILSKDMGVFSNKPDRSVRQVDFNGEGGKSFDFAGQNDGLSPTSLISKEWIMPIAPCSVESSEGKLDLPGSYKANPGSSPPLHSGGEWRTRPTLAPASLFNLTGEMQSVLSEDVGHGRNKNAGGVAQAPAALLESPEISEWGGVADGTGNENRLAAEDWLHVAHALLDTVADPRTDC